MQEKQGSFRGLVKTDGWLFFQVLNLADLRWDKRPYFEAPGLDTGDHGEKKSDHSFKRVSE